MMITFTCAVVALTAILRVNCLQDIPERGRHGLAYLNYSRHVDVDKQQIQLSYVPRSWNSKVDNFDSSSNATFSQRFFENDLYWKSSGSKGPVFFVISGEGTCSGPPTGYVATLGAKYSALLITLEHRFYGESIPNNNCLTDNYNKHLSVEQALADLAAFTDFYKSITPMSAQVPWFVFGGSYSGGLASWYRSAYPDRSVGALSSSGVVDCIVDFYQFDMQVSSSAGNKCSNGIKRVQLAFQNMIEGSPAGLSHALGLFYCEPDMSETDFYYMIADSWSMMIQYGSKLALCALLESSITANSSDEEVTTVFSEYSNKFWGKSFCSMGFYNTKALADPSRWDVNSRSWRYQTCKQVSYFNTAPPSGSLRSTSVDLTFHLQQCAAIFGEPLFPTSVAFNRKFGGSFPAASRVFYSDFSDDPWQRASVWFAPSSSQPYHLAACEDCGHCQDLRTPSSDDPRELVQLRAEFEEYLALWLSSY